MLQRLLVVSYGVLLAVASLVVALPATAAILESAKPWLGVGIEKGPKGVLINRVIAGTPAEGAGLRLGDEITAIGPVSVKDPPAMITAVQNQGVGNSVTVHFIRAGKSESQAIKLVARPDQQELIRRQLLGHKAPPFQLERIHGEAPATSEQLLGRVTILEFWATWCPACRSTHARLSAFAAAHRQDKLAVLAISDEERVQLTAYAAAVKPDFTILRDKDQTTMSSYLVSSIPELVVIDQQGQIAFVTLGAGSYVEEGLQKAEQLLLHPATAGGKK